MLRDSKWWMRALTRSPGTCVSLLHACSVLLCAALWLAFNAPHWRVWRWAEPLTPTGGGTHSEVAATEHTNTSFMTQAPSTGISVLFVASACYFVGDSLKLLVAGGSG
jgi:hypothetical protein